MARLSFRQGIVKDYQGSDSFLTFNGNFISLVATTNENVQVAFVHGPKDYLFTERSTVPQAWGPFTGTDPRWLYWDINRATGVRTFGSTDKEPVESSTAPSTPAPGQMWFDTISKEWKEWSGSSWVIVIRVFAAKLSNGSTFDSMSINATSGDFKGTQVGLTTQTRAGSLVFDLSGNPLLDANNRFFTTEDQFVTGLPTGSRLRISNIIKTAVADENIPSFSAVSLNGVNQVKLATVADQGQKVIGLVDNSASKGDLIDFVTEGVFFNSNWNWDDAGLNVNDPIYIDNTGTITDNSQSSDQLPIGVVMDAQTIMFAPRLFPQIQGSGAGAVSMNELSDVTIDDVNAIENTQGLSWNENDGVWEPATELKTVGGPIVGDVDNAASLRMRGTQSSNEGGNKVQSYMGIFHDPGFTNIGTLETRAIYGANAEMDLVLQSPNQLQIIASDSNTNNGQIWLTSRSDVVINTREEAEGIANNQLIIDRVDTSTVGVGNTSDVQLSVSSGTLQVASDVVIQGDLEITGTTTTINTQDLTISDNVIILNSDVTGTPSQNAGIEVNRGDQTNASILWDENTDSWKIGLSGSETEISLLGHTHDTADITSGTFTDARIAETNVTQHEGALTITESQIADDSVLARVGDNETITGNWIFSGMVQFQNAIEANVEEAEFVFGMTSDNENYSWIVQAGDTFSISSGNHAQILEISHSDGEMLVGLSAASGNGTRTLTVENGIYEGTSAGNRVYSPVNSPAIDDLSDVYSPGTIADQSSSLRWDAYNDQWKYTKSPKWEYQSIDLNLLADVPRLQNKWILDTSGNIITVSVPDSNAIISPINGETFEFIDVTGDWATNNVTLQVGGTTTFSTGGTTYTANTNNARIEIIFLNDVWYVIELGQTAL